MFGLLAYLAQNELIAQNSKAHHRASPIAARGGLKSDRSAHSLPRLQLPYLPAFARKNSTRANVARIPTSSGFMQLCGLPGTGWYGRVSVHFALDDEDARYVGGCNLGRNLSRAC